MTGFAGIDVDEEVIAKARLGDPAAHETVYRAFSSAVYTLALRMAGQPAKADDILQETFIEVMRSIPQFRGDAALATWIRRIAVSKSLMLLRNTWERRSRALPAEAIPVMRSAAEHVDCAMDLSKALDTLDSLSRVVVWLHDVEGYTHREIGALTGNSASFSKSRLARAHERLRLVLVAEPKPILNCTATRTC